MPSHGQEGKSKQIRASISTGNSDDHSLPCDSHMSHVSIVSMDPIIVLLFKIREKGTLLDLGGGKSRPVC